MSAESNHVWVVEMKIKGKWEPCAGMGITRKDALRELYDTWVWMNPDDKFRIRKYKASK